MSWWKPVLVWIGKQALAYAGEVIAEKATEKATPKKPRRSSRLH